MPAPRTESAPRFSGKNVRHFLHTLIEFGTRTGITNHNELVPYILWYSSEEVKRVICFLPEFDKDIPNKEWSAAKEMLVSLYGSSDEPETATEEDLRAYCRSTHDGEAFADK